MYDTVRVLIVDDDRRMAKTLMDILKVKGYQAERAHSAEEAIELIRTEAFDCVLTDIKMPGVNGVALYRAIKKDFPEIPVVLMTAYATDALVNEGLEEGAIASLTKPLDINMLLGFLSSLRLSRTVMFIDNDPKFCRTMGDILLARGYEVVEITDPRILPESFETDVNLVVLLDMNLKDTSVLDVLQQITREKGYVPVILMTGHQEETISTINAAMELGAYTCLYKPIQVEELIQTMSDVRHKALGRTLGRTVPSRSARGTNGE